MSKVFTVRIGYPEFQLYLSGARTFYAWDSWDDHAMVGDQLLLLAVGTGESICFDVTDVAEELEAGVAKGYFILSLQRTGTRVDKRAVHVTRDTLKLSLAGKPVGDHITLQPSLQVH